MMWRLDMVINPTVDLEMHSQKFLGFRPAKVKIAIAYWLLGLKVQWDL